MQKILLLVTAAIVLVFAPVSAQAITIGGDFSDWTGIGSVVTDSNDTGGDLVDYLDIRMTEDATNLYLYYQTVGNIDFGANAWRYNMLFDTDQLTSTGCNSTFNPNLVVGADYLLQGGTLFVKAGGPTDHGWNWTNLGMQSFNVVGKQAEFSFAKSTIGSPAILDLQGFGDNATTADYTAKGTYPIPEPTSLLLLGSGVVGLIGFARKKK